MASSNNQSHDSVGDQNKTDEDPELDSLLDSALEDFDSLNIENESGKTQATQESNADQAVAVSAAQAADNSGQNPLLQGDMQNWNTLLNDQMMAEMEKVMQEIMGSEEGKRMMSNLEEMTKLPEQQTEQTLSAGSDIPTESSANVNPGNITQSADFANASFASSGFEGMDDNFAQALRGLAENAEALKQPNDSFNFGSSPEDIEKLLPAVQGMMENLLAKDVVYPSVKETTAKYTVWLQENQGKIEPEAYTRYSKQYDLMREICCEYESEQPDDSQEIKRQRFDRLTELMNKMHDYGQPPTDIVGNAGMGLEFDENGQIKLPGNMRPEECSLM